MGGKNARNNFSRNTLIERAENVGKKIVAKKYEKKFYIHTNIVTKKWGGKNTLNNFSRNTRIVREKYVGEKSRWKKNAKTRFLYLHEYRDQKMKGKERAKQFFQKHTNSASKKVRKKIVVKKCEKQFFIITRIS